MAALTKYNIGTSAMSGTLISSGQGERLKIISLGIFKWTSSNGSSVARTHTLTLYIGGAVVFSSNVSVSGGSPQTQDITEAFSAKKDSLVLLDGEALTYTLTGISVSSPFIEVTNILTISEENS